MAIAVTTQRQVQLVRRALDRCYICSDFLPPRGSPQRRLETMGEHVIPRGILGNPPPAAANAWPVVLDVHTACERRHKAYRDGMIKIVQKLVTCDVRSWSEQEQQLLLKKFYVGGIRGASNEVLPVMHGVGEALQTVSIWLRGMHAALYGIVLPPVLKEVTMPPVPGMTGSLHAAPKPREIDQQLAASHDMTSQLVRILEAAHFCHKVDRITCWGGTVEYFCTWIYQRRRCLGCWGLIVPGVLQWSATVTGVPTPWHGCFELTEPPLGASIVTPEDQARFARWIAFKSKHGL